MVPADASSAGDSLFETIIVSVREHLRYFLEQLPAPAGKSRRAYHNAYMRTVYRPSRCRMELTFLPEDYHRFVNLAADAGMRPAVYVREAAIAQSKQRVIIPKSYLESIDRVANELNHIGRSANQVARYVNIKRGAASKDVKQLYTLLERVETILSNAFHFLPVSDH